MQDYTITILETPALMAIKKRVAKIKSLNINDKIVFSKFNKKLRLIKDIIFIIKSTGTNAFYLQNVANKRGGGVWVDFELMLDAEFKKV